MKSLHHSYLNPLISMETHIESEKSKIMDSHPGVWKSVEIHNKFSLRLCAFASKFKSSLHYEI